MCRGVGVNSKYRDEAEHRSGMKKSAVRLSGAAPENKMSDFFCI